MKKLFFIMAYACLIITVNAQNKELKVGDQVPNLPIVNTSTGAFSDRLLILDFWNTSCKSCVASWPKLQDLQNKLGNKIQILIINAEPKFDTKERLDKFFKSRKDRKLFIPDLPFINYDTVFKKMFPYFVVPHLVWINKGKVIAISENYYLNVENIEKALAGSLNLPVKVAHGAKYDPSKPLFMNGNGAADSAIIYRSAFTRFVPDLPGVVMFRRNNEGKIIGFACNNGSKYNLYEILYSRMVQNPEAFRQILDLRIRDTFGFFDPTDVADFKNFKDHHLYCYDVTIPENGDHDIFSIMHKDLDVFFKYNSYLEMRDLPCYKLIRTSGKDKIISKRNEVYNNLEEPDVKEFVFTNTPWEGSDK